MMHGRFLLGILFAVFICTCSAQNSSTIASSTVASSTDASSTDASSTVASSPAASVSTSDTSAPDPSASTSSSGSPNPSDESTSSAPDSTTGGTGTTVEYTGSTTPAGSTAVPASSTASGQTTGTPATQGPTTTEPLPTVKVQYSPFGIASCDSEVCIYQLDTPKNDQSFLGTEQSIIGIDRDNFTSIAKTADESDKQLEQANSDALTKIKQLQATLNEIQTNLNTIQSNIAKIQSQQQTASSNLYFVEQYINQLSSAPNNCFYQACLRPTTPPPPTTTPTPAPTTTPSPCVNFTCPTDTDTTKDCQLDSSNRPYCSFCNGDLDPYTGCTTVSCVSNGVLNFGSNKTTKTDWLSYGYIVGNETVSKVPANANCQWNLTNPNGNSGFTVADGYNLTCLDGGSVQLRIITDTLDKYIISSVTARNLRAFFDATQNARLILTSSSGNPGYCKINLEPKPKPELTLTEKPNGFFSWLLGN